MRRVLTAVALIAVLSAVMLALPIQDSDADDPVPPQQLYPDADAVISEAADGSLLIVTKDPGSDSGYSTRTQRAGSAVRLASLSSLDGSYSVVMAGGTVGDLTLVTVDIYDPNRSAVDISFEQLSGSVNRLWAVVVSSAVSRSLPGDYSSLYSPIGELSIEASGRITELSPTTDRIGVSSASIHISGGIIDRLYPTGDDGRYGSVSVMMLDGAIGYMSNQSSVVDALSYRFIRGSVEYLCLGADVESRNSINIADKWTFYVTGDVDVRIESGMQIGRVIIGAGIIDRPSVLCNSQSPEPPSVSRDVVIDSVGVDLVTDRAFLVYSQPNVSSGDEVRVYRFQTYTMGSEPVQAIINPMYSYNFQPHTVYGDDGIWRSVGGISVQTGAVAYLQADIVVRYGTALEVSAGASVVLTGDIVLYGTMVNSGYVDNGGLIEERESGSFSGNDPDGTGHLVQTIYAATGSSRLDLMTVTRTAVAIRGYDDAAASFGAAMVMIDRLGCTLLISASGGLVTGDPVVVSVEQGVPDSGWSYSWDVYVSVADTVSGDVPIILFTVPYIAEEGTEAQLSGPSGAVISAISSDSSETTFVLAGNGVYQFRSYRAPDPDPEPEEPVEEEDNTFLKNMAIAVAIVAIASVVVYLLLRRP